MNKRISKNDVEVLCRLAWKGATNTKMAIDTWIKRTEFNKYLSNQAEGITIKAAKQLCRAAWWDARVNHDVYPSIQDWFDKHFSVYLNDILGNKMRDQIGR